MIPAVAESEDVTYELRNEKDGARIPADARSLDLSSLAPQDFGLLTRFDHLEYVYLGSYDRNGALSDAAIEALARCGTLRGIRASNQPFWGSGWLAKLSKLANLEELDVSRSVPPYGKTCDATWGELGALIEATRLRRLDISDCRFSGDVEEFLRPAQKLETLFCSSPSFQFDPALEKLVTLPLLELHIRAGVLTSNSLRVLGERESLQSLVLDSCSGVTLDGIAAFAEHARITALGLRQFDHMTDADVAAVASIRTLRSLDIAYHVAYDVGESRFAEPPSTYRVSAAAIGSITAMPFLHRLCIAGCPFVNDEVLNELADAKSLHTLDMSFCSGWTRAGLQALLKAGQLRRLHACRYRNYYRQPRSPLDDQCLKLLAEYGRLEYLDLAFNDSITPAGAEMLGDIENLQGIDLSGCGWISPGAAASFKKLKRLRFVSLAETYATNKEVLAALEGHLTLSTLWVCWCGNVSNDCLASVESLPSLAVLDFRATNASGVECTEFVMRLRKRGIEIWHSPLDTD